MTTEEVRLCTNCNRTHGFHPTGWFSCDPLLPHGYMSYTGLEGQCQHCGEEPDRLIHHVERLVRDTTREFFEALNADAVVTLTPGGRALSVSEALATLEWFKQRQDSFREKP